MRWAASTWMASRRTTGSACTPYVETLAAQGIALVAVLALFAIGAARQAKTRRRAERTA